MLFASLVFVLLSLAHSSTAQLPTPQATSVLTQHFIHPIRGDVLLPGSIFTIRWDLNPAFKNLTLQLWDKTSWGFSRDLLSPCHPWARNPFCGTIATSAPNTGSFDWTVPNPPNGSLGYGFPRGEKAFWVKMYVEDYMHEEIGNVDPVLSYSQNFAFAKEGEAPVLATEEASSTVPERGPPTVYVTVIDNGTATATSTGTGGSVKETATATRMRNGTAMVPVEGKASRIGYNVLGGILLLLGAM